ncbi:MAG: type IV pilus twitching motility protein PilT [Polyangiaceae bacterium]|nr:type IV pilus twitching motility protein PilT [Polyangiaceae bacterium]
MRSGGSSADIDRLLTILLETKGSDLHICSGVKPMIRVDGDMRALTNQAQLTPEAVQKMLWPIVPPLNREEFTRRRDTDFAYEIPGKARFRANMFVDRRGVGGVFRIIPSDIMTGEDLGIPSEILHRFSTLQKGLVLVTGPTGSGKSTTLNAFVDYINRNRSAHIITIEDPIEFVHENRRCLINQRQVGQHTDSFKDALRAALREDPDIILVGEIRDLETIEIALETAETGHLVFGTLHTSSAASTVDRIIDQFPADRQSQIRVMLSSSLMGVIAQVLCKKTNGGRVAAYEILIGIPAVSNLIREQKVFQLASVMQTGRKLGMRMMADSLVALVKGGAITPEEAITKAQDRSQLMAAFAAENIEPMSPKSGTKSPRSKKKKGG